jgi:hypothetical protein
VKNTVTNRDTSPIGVGEFTDKQVNALAPDQLGWLGMRREPQGGWRIKALKRPDLSIEETVRLTGWMWGTVDAVYDMGPEAAGLTPRDDVWHSYASLART